MFDPLANSSSAAAFGGEEESAWPSAPHPSPIPNLRRAVSPTTPVKEPTPGLYGRQPQIYGQPDPGLISPQDNAFNGVMYERQEPYLRVRITGLDRNRRDILVKFDAQTNLSNFTGTTYRNVTRSYLEFQQFYDAAVQSNPQTIIPALPLAQTSAPTDEEDDRLVRIMLQRWISRVTEDPILLHDEDLRSFIESDFGYQPIPRPRRKTSTGFSLIRRGVPDEDEELQRARFELTKLEGQFFETAKAIDKLAMTRKSLAVTHAEMGNKLVSVATTEAHPPLGAALRKLGRTWHSLADLDQAQAISECVIIGDSLGYQGLNARSAKETLQMRTGVLEEYQAAVKTTINKRRTIERLKGSSNIRREKVDDAIEDMEEANKYEQVLARRADGISQNLHKALQTHNRYANDDITTALIEYARSSIMYERQLLKELEALRGDISNADKPYTPPTNGGPRPIVVPPLEDFSARPLPPPSAPPMNGHRGAALAPPLSSRPTVSENAFPTTNPSHATPDPLQIPPPATPNSSVVAISSRSETPVLPPSSNAHPDPSPVPTPVPKPTAARIDGTKSMFITPTAPVSTPSAPMQASVSANSDPLLGQSVAPQASGPSNTVADPLSNPSLGHGRARSSSQGLTRQAVDPLANLPSHHPSSSSVRFQPPARPRLDARDAARKLANSGF